jgi:hypothetical protein
MTLAMWLGLVLSLAVVAAAVFAAVQYDLPTEAWAIFVAAGLFAAIAIIVESGPEDPNDPDPETPLGIIIPVAAGAGLLTALGVVAIHTRLLNRTWLDSLRGGGKTVEADAVPELVAQDVTEPAPATVEERLADEQEQVRLDAIRELERTAASDAGRRDWVRQLLCYQVRRWSAEARGNEGREDINRAVAALAGGLGGPRSSATVRRAGVGLDLRGAHLVGLDLEGGDLRGASLGNATLARAHLRRVDLTGAVLIEADLRGTVFDDVDLRDARLQRADLRDADLRKSNLHLADVQDVRTNKRTRLPGPSADGPSD